MTPPEQQPIEQFTGEQVQEIILLAEARAHARRNSDDANGSVALATVVDGLVALEFATKGPPTTLAEGLIEAGVVVLTNGYAFLRKRSTSRKLKEANAAFDGYSEMIRQTHQPLTAQETIAEEGKGQA